MSETEMEKIEKKSLYTVWNENVWIYVKIFCFQPALKNSKNDFFLNQVHSYRREFNTEENAVCLVSIGCILFFKSCTPIRKKCKNKNSRKSGLKFSMWTPRDIGYLQQLSASRLFLHHT